MTYYIFKDKAGKYSWHYKASNGNIMADSGQGYAYKEDCLHGIEVLKNSQDVDVIDQN